MDIQLRQWAHDYTSLGVGGRIWAWCSVGPDQHSVIDAVELAAQCDTPIVVLGSGTNVLVADEYQTCMVLRIVMPENECIWPDRDYQTDECLNVRVYACASWDALVRYCIGHNLQGLECMSGIPGTVGGAVAGSIGAYGQQVSDVITKVEAIELRTGFVKVFTAQECQFGYRTSMFNRPENLDRYLVTQALFRLREVPAPNNLVTIRDHTLSARKAKGMLAGQHRSAGSFFKNPTLPDDTRIPAAKLIEEAGFTKGYTRNGRAGLSSDHVLALVNLGDASAADIVALAREVQERVSETSGIVLEPEVRLIGFPEYPLLRP